MKNHLSFTRLRGLIKKEAIQIIRDPSSIGIAFFLPVILLIIFGYGVSLDAEHVPIGLVLEKPSHEASSFISGFYESDFFKPKIFQNVSSAQHALMNREIIGFVWIKSDFSKNLISKEDAPIGVILNGVDANQAKLVSGYITGVWLKWLSAYSKSRAINIKMPIEIKHRIWFNSAVRSRNFLVPGLIAVIMTLIGGMLTSLIIAREWERGTMEALLVTPVRTREIILSKVIPYFILGMGGMALSVFIAIYVFDVPFRGSFIWLFIASSLFMLTAIALGLIISITSGSQFVAGQIAIVITFLPAFMLSGFVFDIDSMPLPIQGVTHIVAARYFVSILQSLFLVGNVWEIFIKNCLWLFLMAVVFFLIIKKKSHKRLI